MQITRDIITKYFHWMRDNGFKYRTADAYSDIIVLLIRSKPHIKERNELTGQDIWDFIKTKNYPIIKSSIKKFLYFSEKELGLTIKNVRFPGAKKTEKKEREPLTLEETQKLISAIHDKKHFLDFSFLAEVVANGFTIMEVLPLTKKNIRFEDKVILVQGNRQKKFVSIPDELIDKLSKVCEDLNDDDLVFDFRYKLLMKKFRRKQRLAKKNNTYFISKDLWDLKYFDKSVCYFSEILSRISQQCLNRKITSTDLSKSPLSNNTYIYSVIV